MFTIPLPWPDSSLLLSPPWAGLPWLLRAGLLAGICIVPIVLLLVLYRYELRLVSRLTAMWLLGLRLCVFVLVLALVCLQPIYAHERREELPGRVVVAVDRSLSTDIRDPQRAGADKLRLARALGMTRGVIGEDWLARWIEDHEQKRDPRLTDVKDGDDPQVRLRLQTQRQQAHDQLIKGIDALTRADLARLVLADDGLGLLSRIGRKHEVELLSFDRDSQELKPEHLAQALKDGGDSRKFTDLASPLLRTRERSLPGQGKVLGIVLLTDGQHNTGPSPANLARELGQRKVPIYPLALGEMRSPPDAAIVSIRGPDYSVFKDVEAVIEVRVKLAGLKEQEYVVELVREGKEKKPLASRMIRHDGRDRVYTETFPIKLDEVGTHTIAATVRPVVPQEKETSEENNRQATTVSVADDRARVLLVDGEARWEYHYLSTALMRDRLIDLGRIVFTQLRLDERLSEQQREKLGLPAQKWPSAAQQGMAPVTDPLTDQQCIILGDIDPSNMPLEQRQRLERFVADTGGTLIVVAGKRFMPLAYPENTTSGEPDPLRRLLPIESPHVLAPVEGFRLSLTTAGRETRFMELDPEKQENDTLWAGHPRPWGWAVAGRAKPCATPLACWFDPGGAKLPMAEREKRQAVVVRHTYDFGRVLYIGIDSTWRWRYKIGDLYHHRFWGQVVRWAASDKPLVVGNGFIRFGTPAPVYRPGEAVEIVARLNDNLGQLRADLLAGARILKLPEGPKEEERAVALAPLERRPAQPRVLEGKLRDLPPGRYAVELAIPDLADKLLTEPGKERAGKPLRATFSVLPPDSKEMIDLELNRPLLDDLAMASGGKVFTPTNADELEKLLVAQGIPQVEHQEQKVWQWWGFLAIVVVLLTLEWVARKLAGLP